MKIEEFARIITTLRDLHPNSEMQFVYPTKRGKKPWRELARDFNYVVLSSLHPTAAWTVRLVLDTHPSLAEIKDDEPEEANE
jgi:hypothetical protein